MPRSTDFEATSGPTHEDIHAKLTTLGYAISSDEFARGTLGATTRAALREFQTQQGLKATGAVNKKTVAALAAASPPPSSDGGGPMSSYTVSGTVTNSSGIAVGGLGVILLDKNVGADVPVAKGQTNASGSFALQPTITAAYLEARGKTSPDLQVQVIVGGHIVATSEVAYGGVIAGPLDVSLPPNTAGLPSEYESLTASLRSIYSGPLDGLQENADRQDITYLAQKCGLDARGVALRALGDKLASENATDGEVGIDSAFYYALLRAGVDADEVFAVGAPYAKAVWTLALADNIIPASLAGEVDGAIRIFTKVAAAQALTASPAIGPSTLGEIVAISLGDDTSAGQTFAELYVQARGGSDELWQQVGSALGAKKAAALQFDGKLAYLLVNNAPLLSALHAATPLTNPPDLASNGYHDPAAWLKLLSAVEPPAEVPGAAEEDRKAAYADFLAAQVRISFPTETVSHLVASGAIHVPEGNGVQSAVAGFLQAQGQSFDIGAEPVATFVARTGTSLSPDAANEVTRIQRVYQLAPDTQSLATLLNAGLDSACAIVRLGRDAFAARYANALDAETLKVVFQRAVTIHTATLQVAVNYLGACTAPTVGGTASMVIDSLGATDGSPQPARATLDDLFQNLDYCSCDDCQSITSPAAYLVDLLDFLDHPAATPNPLDSFLGRRPDIGELQLTCENTNTALPYLDLVNEALEYYVGNSLSLINYAGHNNDGSISSAELIAAPQFDDDLSAGTPYTILEGTCFPPPLPFHRNLELLRLHLTQLGTSVHDVLRAFRYSDSLEAATLGDPMSYGWRDILAERLALSRPRDTSAPDGIGGEYRLLTDSSLTLAQLYGFPSGTSDSDVINELSPLREFSRRTSVDYEDLVLILGTSFVNPASSLLPLVSALSVSASTLSDLQSGALTTAGFVNQLPAGLDATRYGGTTLDDVAAWVLANYTAIMSLITIAVPDEPDAQCDTSQMTLRYLNPDSSASILQPIDFVRLLRFIRLWSKLGLSIPQTDAVVAALLPPSSGSGSALAQIDQAFMTLLPRIGVAFEVLDELGLSPADTLDSLVTCWADIGSSLYATLFLTRSVLEQDAVFELDETGVALAAGGTTPIAGHEPGLCAALNLTAAELVLLLGPAPGLDLASAMLTLDNVSAIYRRAWLARTLELSVVELLHLIADTGIDPFALPTIDSTAPFQAPLLEFVRLVKAMDSASVEPVQTLYLHWNDDLSGVSSPNAGIVPALASALRSSFIAVDAQFHIAANPTMDAAKALVTLVLGAGPTDVFFGLLNETLVTSVPFAYASSTLPTNVLTASGSRLSYDDLAKQLSYAGYLDPTTLATINAAVAGDATLQAGLATLSAQNQTLVDRFFATYTGTELDLRSAFDAYTSSADPTVRGSLPALLSTLLPALADRRKQEQAYAAATASAGCDPSFAPALLGDPSVLPTATSAAAPTGPQAPGIDDLTALAALGLSVEYFLTDDPTAPPDVSEIAAGLAFSPAGPNTLPSPTSGSTVAGTWRGFLAAPQGGDYNLSVAAEAASSVKVAISGQPIAMTSTGVGTFANAAVITLPSGALAEIELTVTGLKDSLSVSWETVGLGWQQIPEVSLYSGSLLAALSATYLRFLKATALAADLQLEAAEVAALARSNELHIGGQSWLAAMVVSGVPAATESTELTALLDGLLAYSALRRRFAASRTTLIDVFRDIALVLPNGMRALTALTGWDSPSIDMLAQRFFATTDLASIGTPLLVLRRLAEAFVPVTVTGVSVATFVAAATNDPSRQLVSDFQAAVRSRYAESDWLAVVTPINDTIRERQRDALVAYILGTNGPQILAALGIADTRNATADDLFAYFLMDVEMEACMETSRIRLALSASQLFIERCLRNLEPGIAPGTLSTDAWTSMKRYRVWQANREVFLWPENWLDPSLRDDKSPIFGDALGRLLQGDLTDDSAANAFLDYLSGLELVAKLELCGIYYEPGGSDGSGEVAHVVGRTSGMHRKYYYRRLEFGSWTPWEEIKLPIEDNPVIPYVWNGRLMLFWLQIHQSSAFDLSSASGVSEALPSNPPGQLATPLAGLTLTAVTDATATAAPTATRVRIQATLCFSELYNGKWQPVKSTQTGSPLDLGSYAPGSFDRRTIELRPWVSADPSDTSLYVEVASSSNYPVPNTSLFAWIARQVHGFVVHNTHSSPILWTDMSSRPSLDHPNRDRLLTTGSNQLTASYAWVGPPSLSYYPLAILHPNSVPVIAGSFPFAVRSSEPDVTDQWVMPFLLEDHHNAFFVTTQAQRTWFPWWNAVGISGLNETNEPSFARLVPDGVQHGPGSPITGLAQDAAQPGTASMRVLIDGSATVNFGGTAIGPFGSFDERAAGAKG